MTEEVVKAAFIPFGEIKDVSMPLDNIKRARITLVEYMMTSSILMVPMNEEAAIEDLKGCSQTLFPRPGLHRLTSTRSSGRRPSRCCAASRLIDCRADSDEVPSDDHRRAATMISGRCVRHEMMC